MAVIVVGSVHGSPGATTLAFDLARQAGPGALLIEADPDGGVLAARLELALKPGLMELAGAARTGIEADDLWKFAQLSSTNVAVVAGHPAAEQTSAALRAAIIHISSAAALLDTTVVIDIGRLRPGSPSLGASASADHTLIVSDNSVEAIVSLTHRAQLLNGCAAPMVVLNQDGPYTPEEIASASHQCVWGVVPPARSRRDERQRASAIGELVVAFSAGRAVELFTEDTAVNS